MPARGEERRKISKIQWQRAIEACGGVVRDVATTLQIHRVTIYHRRKKHKWLDDMFLNVEEERKDIAESVVNRCMDSPNDKTALKAATWYLDRKGQDRGYGKQIKVDADVNNNGVLHLYLPDDERDQPSQPIEPTADPEQSAEDDGSDIDPTDD